MRKFINSIINNLSTILTTIFGILVLFGFAGIVLLIAFPIYGISKFVVLVLSIQPICSWLTMEIANGIPIGSIIWFILCFVFSLFCLYLTVKDDFFGASTSSHNRGFTSTTTNENQHSSDGGFYDGRGNWRRWDDAYQDAQGNWRNPGEPFVDGQGKLRSPGEPWQDSEGHYYQPGQPFRDGKGIWRK